MSSDSNPPSPVIRRSMLFILPLLGLCSGLLHQYHLVQERKTWNEAQSYCREKYTDLAIIYNMEDMNRMIDSVGSYKGVVWIGLYDEPDSWRWSLSDEMDGEGEVFRNWATKEPSNSGGKQFCVIMVNGFWFDTGCENHHHFVCYNTNVHGTTATTSGRYIHVTEPKTWTDAQHYCRQHHTDLARLKNQAENQEMDKLLPRNEWVWIGLFKDSWRSWSGGSNSSFTYWRDGQPGNELHQEKCAISRINPTNLGTWEDMPCSNQLNFICYKSPEKKLFKIKVMSDSTVDLNNPAVMEAILKQMETKLKDKLGHNHVKLGWGKSPDGNVFHKEEKKKKAVLVKREL